ncbi:MAG: LacI family transcriptional regulator [Victivallales bacterium]|jgi:DNA-binding LacI/PurR family transcriptional regulator|nr:LacI family transcriptional regulator [Victivallales bacterium]
MAGKVLLKDLAAAEGISLSQVSRALRQQSGVAPEIRERLLKRAREMNYRNCSSHHVNKIAVLYDGLSNFISLVSLLEREVAAKGWKMFAVSCDNVEVLSELFADGIFFLGYNKLSSKLPDIIKSSAVVAINDYPDTLEHIGSVLPDADGESEIALQHLFSLGHRKIARLRLESPGESLRWENRGLKRFYEVAEEYGIRDSVIYERYREDSIDECIGNLLKSGITAIIDVNHEPAHLLYTLRKYGKRIPEDISLITYENPNQSRWQHPTLTTLAFDTEAIVRNAIRLMGASLRQQDVESVIIPTKLIIRESTGRPPLCE